MDVLTALEQRRAIKSYDPNHIMPDADIKQLLSAAMLSPTSFNIQHWRFVVVTDMATRQAIRAVAWDQAHVTESSALIIVCADIKAWEKEPSRYWQNAGTEKQTMLVGMLTQFYQGRDQLQRDEAIRSSGMAAQSIMLAAKEMGYDTNPMIGFDADKVGEIIHLPHDHVIGMMITVGKKTKDAFSRGGQLSYDDVVFYNHFPT
jgi:nitroreductase